MKIIDYSEFMC